MYYYVFEKKNVWTRLFWIKGVQCPETLVLIFEMPCVQNRLFALRTLHTKYVFVYVTSTYLVTL